MSALDDHDAEQAEITALCEAGKCDHTDCNPSWHAACRKVFNGAIQNDTNDERAARVALCVYPGYDDDNLETAIRDVLGDLRHLCDLMSFDFDNIASDAKETYWREVDMCKGKADNARLREALEGDLQ